MIIELLKTTRVISSVCLLLVQKEKKSEIREIKGKLRTQKVRQYD
jgi:hypothetical protein